MCSCISKNIHRLLNSLAKRSRRKREVTPRDVRIKPQSLGAQTSCTRRSDVRRTRSVTNNNNTINIIIIIPTKNLPTRPTLVDYKFTKQSGSYVPLSITTIITLSVFSFIKNIFKADTIKNNNTRTISQVVTHQLGFRLPGGRRAEKLQKFPVIYTKVFSVSRLM